MLSGLVGPNDINHHVLIHEEVEWQPDNDEGHHRLVEDLVYEIDEIVNSQEPESQVEEHPAAAFIVQLFVKALGHNEQSKLLENFSLLALRCVTPPLERNKFIFVNLNCLGLIQAMVKDALGCHLFVIL